jgi:hypothetical protein
MKTIKEEFVYKLLNALSDATSGCAIQTKGCPCRTCFFALCEDFGLSNEIATNFWHVVLELREGNGYIERCKKQKEN